MQCDPQCSDYSACTSACPVETCDNLLDQGEAARICHHENCVEGCLIKPCPPGQIYYNDTYTACVSKTECRPVCLVKDDRKYYEGDVTYSDDCATCRCSKKKEICSGIPCPPTVTTTESPIKVTGSTEEPNQQGGKNCIHGWSRWFDRGSNVGGINLNDLEPLPKYDKFESIYGTCDREYMSHIECRVKDSKVPFDLVDDNVVCNLDKGLVCVGKCHDYEIRVKCQCDEQGRTTPKPPTTPPPTEPCDPDKGLFKEYPGDCHQYLRCMRKIGVSQWFWVSGTCGPNLMFNPSIGTCDQIATVSRIRSECRKTTDPCTDDQQWSDCANQCEHTCHFFGQQLIRRGLCKPNEHCKPGCVPKKRPDCKALGKFWRDDATCVDKDDCPCLDDHRDVYVKPHDTIITAQFDCQCVYNRFICVPKETTTETPPIGGNATTTPVPILPTTLTPPILCPPSSLIRLFTKGPTIRDDAFTASSHLNDKYKPHLARLHRKPKLNDGAWSPQVSDKSQYLQLKFENPLAIYGLLIAGDPHFDNYVTLFKVVYSLDGQSFHEVIDNTGQVQLFRGPKDSRAAIAQVFERPIEAISLRLYALKWQNTIALRVDFLLCNHLPSTTSKPPILTTPLPPTKPPTFKLICEDPLGVNNGALRQHQVSASSIWLSSLVDSQTSLLDLLKFNNQLGWRPLANKVDEFVDFDFLQPRNITAIQTRGGKSGWVTSYRVLFSLNKQIWNELPGPNDKSQIFKGNQDSQNDWRNDFERPIVTRYLRLIPTTWEHNINWRIEPIGCFLPYPNTTDPPPVKCAICDGFELPQGSQECPCQDGLFWMGTKCVERNHCPCIDNFTPYQIGSKFENKKCEECVCLLGGIISCKAKKCPPCRENTRLVQNGCNCECQLCPPSTRLCPTSGDCIPSEWWCNGVQNCADDEDETCDSKVTTIKPPTTPKPPPECPQIVCPPGYDIKITGKSPKALSSMFLFGFKEDDEVPEQLEVLQEWLGTLKSSPNEEVASAAYKVIASLDANKLEEWREDELAKNQVKAETLTLEQLEINELPLIPGQPEIESNILLKSPFGIEELLEKTQVVESTYPDNLSQEDPLVEEQLETDMKFVWNSGRLTGSGISLYGNDFKLPPELQALLDLQIKVGEDIDMQYCTAFCCLPQRRNVTKCEEPKCPPGYEPKVDETIIPAGSRQCPTFSCRRKRVPDDTCDINGRLFRTFDGTIYKYDICSHILARDIRGQRWSVRAQLQCAQNQNNCGSKTVIIEDKLAGNTLTILPNQRVIFNGYEFDARNLAQSSALRRSFFITHIGETIVVVCRQHKFWVQYGVNGNILLGVSQDLLGYVDGLCGFYNGQLFDDKRTPAGLLLIGTKDFGDSWFDRKLSLDQCRPQVCPVDLQQRALQLCNTVRHPLFDACSKSVNIQDYLDKCVESACQCLQINNGAEGNCRCDLLQQYVRQCLAVNPHLQLTTWRSVHRCPQPCRPPLIHYDCYKRRCEPHCGPQTRSTSVCPTVPNTCFPGCYCPEGTVRNGDDCVPVDDCKDCKCTMFGGNKFVTYDRTSYSFKGNCTYLVSRDLLLPGSYSFQVYVTIKPCGLANLENCVQALHVTAGEHTLHIEGTTNRSVHVIADGYFITLWPHQAPWLRVLQEREGELVVQLIQAKLELTLKLDTMQFLLTVPSVRYGNRMEGLCGNCNGLSIDDLQINQQKKPDKKPKFDLLDFVTSWQISEPRLGIDTQKCNDQNSKICKPLPREKNLCYQLIVNSGIFGRCPLLVNPLAYIQVCQQDTCSDGSDKRDICDALTAYAAECNAVGICVDWRPLAQCPAQCPAGLTYKPCDCYVNCETGIVREDKINQKLLRQERCLHTSRYEGCFCPNDQVLHHGKCVPPGQCISCGDGRHVGDLWQPDKCTKCTCLPSGQVSCEKEQCVQAKDVICQKGYKVQVQNLEFKCCPVYSCIPDIVKPGQQCEEPKLPNCGPNQNRRVDKDINGCPVYICECKPLDQCEPLKVIQLKPGEELHPLITGCCPDQKVVCVPSKCPKHPTVCPQPHYEIVSSLLPGDCCASYQCVPPKDKCLITDNGQVQAYKPGDQWQLPGKPCVSYECVNIDNTIQVVSTVLTCIKECRPGFSYVHNENTDKCCGSCVQTSCVHDGKIYKPNEQWQSLDKCIIYTCVPHGGLLIIHEKQEICLDVSNCPPDQLVDDGGCCKRCKNPPPPKRVNCQTVSVPYERTINLIGYKSPDHGHCSNKEPIRGVTQCEGACSSSSKYNPINEKYLDSCSCCRANSLIKVSVKVQCEDGTSQEHFLDVPKDCSCEPCRHDELLEVKPRPVPTVHDNEESDEELDLQTLLQQS
ncbi:hemocytin-like [Drosophila willistoni]|uniref:hemocytin-like n=1 Tax=Drosophila willistoni TaxID=7260 RepID=UPI001F078AE0|nr:hemocytin-like [Drosophila willistoni]